MIRSFILALLLCATAQAQFMPFAMWRTASAAAPPTDSCRIRLVASSITGKSNGDTTYIWPAVVGPNAYQKTSSLKPIYYADSLNGKPAVRFDNTDDIMETAAFSCISKTITVVAVGRLRAAHPIANIMCEFGPNIFSGANGFTLYWAYSSFSNKTLIRLASRETNAAALTSTNETYSASFYVVASIDRSVNPDTGSCDLNKQKAYTYTTTDNNGDHGTYPLYVGARVASVYPMDGMIAELIIYTKLLTAAERAQLDSYINRTYGL